MYVCIKDGYGFQTLHILELKLLLYVDIVCTHRAASTSAHQLTEAWDLGFAFGWNFEQATQISTFFFLVVFVVFECSHEIVLRACKVHVRGRTTCAYV